MVGQRENDLSFPKTVWIEVVGYLGRRYIWYVVVMREGWAMPERRVYIRDGVCAVVIVDNIVGNGSLGLVGHIKCVED